MTLTQVLYLIPAFLGIGFLIGFHELGHFLFCKLFNVHTPSFSIGFGPKILSKKIGDTQFSLSAIPLGGYVEIAGAAEVGQGEQKEAGRTDEQSFARKPYYQKLLIMLGGIIFNLMFAYAAFIGLYMAGLPASANLYPFNATSRIEIVEKDSPAAQAGLEIGDIITSYNEIPLQDSLMPFLETIKSHPNEQILISYLRNNKEHTTAVTLGERQLLGTSMGFLGIKHAIQPQPGTSFFSAISKGISTTNAYIKNSVYAYAHLLKKRDTNGLGGPVMIISQSAAGAAQGFKVFLLLLAFISISLAILNLIPLPILDGGQILFYSIEALIGRDLPTRVRELIHIASWLGILALTIYLTYQDILRVFFS